MKLYWSPGACSVAVHIMLEEMGVTFELEKVLTGQGDTRKPAHLVVNPKGQVPVLEMDGARLTEVPAIMLHLTLTHGAARGLDLSPGALVRAVEWMNWFSSGVHAGPVTQCWNTNRLTDVTDHYGSIQAKGQKRLREVYELIEHKLPDNGYVLGRFCAVDAVLVGYFRWGNRLGLNMRADFPKWTRHCEMMLERPAVTKVLAKEDLSVWE